MLFVKKLFKKKAQTMQPVQDPWAEDLEKAALWAAENLEGSGYRADFSLDSLVELDRFFDTERTGLLAEHEDKGVVLFTLGAYLGEVVRKAYGGHWQGDDSDPQAEIHVTLVLPNGKAFQPVRACISRYHYPKSQPLHTFVQRLGQSLSQQAKSTVTPQADQLNQD